jgi:hypothetical protein
MRSLIRILLCVSVLTAPGVAAATALFTIGPDDPNALFPVPRELTALSTAGVASPVAALSDGSLAFNGGLAFRPATGPDADRLYAIANDSSGQSTLYRLDLNGANLTSVLSLGSGFTGGLAYDPGGDALYAIQTDLSFLAPPSSSLYRIDLGVSPTLNPLGPLSGIYGGGAGGGLTFDGNDGMLYAIAWDAFGIPRTLSEIDPTPASDTPVFDLGAGDLAFSGGIAYDAVGDSFYAIANDFLANSTLTTFALPDAGAYTPVGPSFGQGFLNTGLALAPNVVPPPPRPAPEPPGLALMLLGMAALGVGRLRERSHGLAPT